MHARPLGPRSAKCVYAESADVWMYARPSVDVETVDVCMYAKPGPETLDPGVNAETVDVCMHAKPGPEIFEHV